MIVGRFSVAVVDRSSGSLGCAHIPSFHKFICPCVVVQHCFSLQVRGFRRRGLAFGCELRCVASGSVLLPPVVAGGSVLWLTRGYLLEFDDDEEDGALPQRTVPFHKVVALPEGHRQ
ncbi:hypothetical protein F2Q70_00031987 [Brassica cretica]|uniref:Uncharacterized protein n=1 Tax=Brassica cretica TaxID=69181 RepID=A0A8S9FD17_BRACR|nr:hypothetical protein F2Q70_00031987 [Brassica cretica]